MGERLDIDATGAGRPTPEQLAYQRERPFGIFCHFGINTFHGKEWSDGTLDPAGFNPTSLDCRQWVETAKQAGASHIILTAKHHDGFCLWPTSTTDYSVASSPWKDGTGDVVADLAAACREGELGLGLYLSPWDRHERSWADDQRAYDALYLRQLTELCTSYGPLVEIWFDGAGSEDHPYDWDSIMGVVDRYQSDAMIFNMGRPTIRWVGNEDGLASDPCWYTVDETLKSIFTDDRQGLAEGGWYLPPECDVAIRRHWFWHPDDLHSLKSVDHLMAIWYRSVGLGANLLLNVPPDRSGRIDENDRARLLEFADALRVRFGEPIKADLDILGPGSHECYPENGRAWSARFPEPVTIDHLVLREAIEDGQRIGRHRIVNPAGGTTSGATSGVTILDDVYTIGSQRIHAFSAIHTDAIVLYSDAREGRMLSVEGYLTGVEAAPSLEEQPEFMSEKVDQPPRAGGMDGAPEGMR